MPGCPRPSPPSSWIPKISRLNTGQVQCEKHRPGAKTLLSDAAPVFGKEKLEPRFRRPARAQAALTYSVREVSPLNLGGAHPKDRSLCGNGGEWEGRINEGGEGKKTKESKQTAFAFCIPFDPSGLPVSRRHNKISAPLPAGEPNPHLGSFPGDTWKSGARQARS